MTGVDMSVSRSRNGLTRRSFAKLGEAAAMALGVAGAGLQAQSPNPAAARSPADDKTDLQFLMDVALDLQGPGGGSHTIGFPGAQRVTVAVTGGTFEGPKLKGTVLTPGGDWLVRR